MNDSLLASIIIITRNRSEDVQLLIEDINKQDYPQIEIVVIDNASENSPLKDLIRIHPQIKSYYSPVNLGVAGGRNKGIELSNGEILIFFDDDSRLEDHKIVYNIVHKFNEDPALSALTFKIVDSISRKVLRQTIPRRDKKDLPNTYRSSYFMGGGFAIRSGVFKKIGLFEERYFYSGEELEFSYRLARERLKILYSPEIEIIHKKNPKGRVYGQRYYYLIRNRIMIALKYLPWPIALSHITLWLIYMSGESIINLRFISFIKGVGAALRLFPQIISERDALSKEDIRYLNKFSGRTYY